MNELSYVNGLVEKAHIAQKEFELFSQEQVDECVRAAGKAVYDNAAHLARLAVDETGMGVYEDKVQKNAGKAKAVWLALKGVKSRGILRCIEDEGIVEVAKPLGVIGAITPVTNPVMTPMHNIMIALKGGNAIIICPHPSAIKTAQETVRIMAEAITKLGAPVNLIQCTDRITLEISELIMQKADICIATGGPGLVKAAYSSGKPAFGVGPGNVQCIIDTDADIKECIPKIIRGRIYDNGILCTCEQSVICHEKQYEAIVETFEQLGAYYVHKPDEVALLREAIFPGGEVNRACIGVSAAKIAEIAGLKVDSDIKLLLVKTSGYGQNDVFSKEKMFPVLAVYPYKTWDEAIQIARANLDVDGKGHSCVIHSNNKDHIQAAAEKINVSRFSVNQTGSNSLGGSLLNGLNPTATLGCGSWGNNSISENLWFHHLINISRIAYEIPDRIVPSDEEIWE